MLSKEETYRYSRHLLMPEIGIAGQEKLKKAKVLVIGAGGLSCPVLLYLTAAGIGEIGIVDFDKVDVSNLQRQIIYTVDAIGKLKVDSAIKHLSKQNPLVKFTPYTVKIDNQNALEIVSNFDIVIDGTDNFSTRYLVNDACMLLNKPLVYGSIYRFEGQVAVFNHTNKNGSKGPSYRCLFPHPPAPQAVPNCSETGVIGILPGIIGTLQANEAIKLIAGIGNLLSGKVMLVNALTMEFNTIALDRNKDSIKAAPSNEEEFKKMTYDIFCGITQQNIKSISIETFIQLLEDKNKLQIIDVREYGEQPVLDELADVQISLNNILKQADKIARDKQVIVICQTGQRSKQAIELLQNKLQLTNLYNLEEGVIGWLREQLYL